MTSLKNEIAAWIELTTRADIRICSNGMFDFMIESAVRIPDIVVKNANPALARIFEIIKLTLSNIL